jgi:hypothetical protein
LDCPAGTFPEAVPDSAGAATRAEGDGTTTRIQAQVASQCAPHAPDPTYGFRVVRSINPSPSTLFAEAPTSPERGVRREQRGCRPRVVADSPSDQSGGVDCGISSGSLRSRGNSAEPGALHKSQIGPHSDGLRPKVS